jgi:hypothetical protein
MSAKTNNFTVDSLEEQVESLGEGCETALAFDIKEYEKKHGKHGKIDFGKLFPCKHLQGMARGTSSDGTPYFFFTRSGVNNCFCPREKNSPGELWIVKMGSRSKDGERLGSNHNVQVEKEKYEREKTSRPPYRDRLRTIVRFDGKTKDWPGWMHPGGAQLIDNVLVFPVGCPDNGTGEVTDGIMLTDLEQPEKPAYLKSIDKFGEQPAGGGAVGVTKMPTGKYLFVVPTVVPTVNSRSVPVLRFGLSNELRDPNLLIDFCCDYALKPDDKFGQSLNFAWDTDGTLYLITFINPWPIPAAASKDVKNEVWLYKVNPDDLREIKVDLIVNKTLPGEPSTYGDANAASGVYVSPKGKLILYIGAHCDSSSIAGMQIKKNGFVNMGEFASVG